MEPSGPLREPSGPVGEPSGPVGEPGAPGPAWHTSTTRSAHRHPIAGTAFLLLGLVAAWSTFSSAQAIVTGSDTYSELNWGHLAGIGVVIGAFLVGVGLLRGSRAACLAGRAAAWIAVAVGFLLLARGYSGQDEPYGGLVLIATIVIVAIIWIVSGLILLGLRHRPR